MFLTSDGITSAGTQVPAEKLQLIFGSLTEVTSANTASWNQITNAESGPTPPAGVTLVALPAANAPALTLDLQPPAGSNLPAVTLDLGSYQFGFKNSTTIGSSGSGAGKITFDDLTVVGPLKRRIAAIVQRAGHRQPLRHGSAHPARRRRRPGSRVGLGTVFLTSDAIASAGTSAPAETLQLIFGSITEVTSANTASWNQITNAENGPTPPAGVTLATLPAANAPALTLDLQPVSGSNLPEVTLDLSSYQFGFENSTTIGPNGAGAGKTTLDDLAVSAPFRAHRRNCSTCWRPATTTARPCSPSAMPSATRKPSGSWAPCFLRPTASPTPARQCLPRCCS